jgi:hypothetical protein
MLHIFHPYEVFSCVFCKCFIRMFRVFQLFRTYVASVSSRCFKRRSGVAASVSNAYFMCFICLQTYVASVASGCFKSRLSVASLSSLFCCLTFVSMSLHPPDAGGGIRRPPPPLLNAGVATCCSLLVVCMCVSNGGDTRHTAGRVEWHGAHVGMQVRRWR